VRCGEEQTIKGSWKGRSDPEAPSIWPKSIPTMRAVKEHLTLPKDELQHCLAIESHNSFQTREVSKESPKDVASRWILSCFFKVLCFLIATRNTDFRTRREGGLRDLERARAHLCCLTQPPASDNNSSQIHTQQRTSRQREKRGDDKKRARI
jgi:hypothetical protein